MTLAGAPEGPVFAAVWRAGVWETVFAMLLPRVFLVESPSEAGGVGGKYSKRDSKGEWDCIIDCHSRIMRRYSATGK